MGRGGATPKHIANLRFSFDTDWPTNVADRCASLGACVPAGLLSACRRQLLRARCLHSLQGWAIPAAGQSLMGEIVATGLFYSRSLTKGMPHKSSASSHHFQDGLAEWSKALASGVSPQGRGFEPHSRHIDNCKASALPATPSACSIALFFTTSPHHYLYMPTSRISVYRCKLPFTQRSHSSVG